jgi:hypothetical protein
MRTAEAQPSHRRRRLPASHFRFMSGVGRTLEVHRIGAPYPDCSYVLGMSNAENVQMEELPKSTVDSTLVSHRARVNVSVV